MAHDVFISYSSQDAAEGEQVCAALERHGISCWMAPRDIVPGVGWAKSIIQAINGARAMVLVVSAHSNDSPQVEREVERAINKGVPVIPLRIENVTLSDALEYFLSSPHWLDAFNPPLEPHLDRLAAAVRTLLDGKPAAVRKVARRADRADVKPSPIATAKMAPETAIEPAIAGRRAILAGVAGTERKALVIGALASVAAVVVTLSAMLIAAGQFVRY